MKVRFWGVRGSYPVPGRFTNRYGGNTACVEVCPDDGTVIIIDAGTGIRRLGQRLMEGPLGRGEGNCHLLISHTHWDHIQGLPFFAPLYVAGNQITIYGLQRQMRLEEIFAGQTGEPYFPVSKEDVAAEVTFAELVEGTFFRLGQAEVGCTKLNHPGLSLGYRVEADGYAMAYISDTAPFDKILFKEGQIARPSDGPPSPADTARLRALQQSVVSLCSGCQLVVYDTMFLLQEYYNAPHWGHSAPEHAVSVAEEARAAAVALFHHGPDRDDEALDRIVGQVQATTELKIIGAAEGAQVSLAGGGFELGPADE